MYGIFGYIWLIFMENVGKCTMTIKTWRVSTGWARGQQTLSFQIRIPINIHWSQQDTKSKDGDVSWCITPLCCAFLQQVNVDIYVYISYL